MLRRWKKNWFVLYRDGVLRYFESPESPRAEEVFVIRSVCKCIKTGDEVSKQMCRYLYFFHSYIYLYIRYIYVYRWLWKGTHMQMHRRACVPTLFLPIPFSHVNLPTNLCCYVQQLAAVTTFSLSGWFGVKVRFSHSSTTLNPQLLKIYLC